MKTKVTEMLGIKYPIIQGAMQYMSLADCAAAVSNAGGLGIVPAMAFADGNKLRDEIQRVKSLTDKPFAFNISLVPEVVIPDLIFEYIDIIINEGVRIVETSGQRPGQFIDPLKKAGVTVIHKVTSVRHGLAAQKDGADIVAFVGAEAGGHPGMDLVSGHVLWSEAVDKMSVPVLAAGGIVDGRDILSAMALGVDGVLLGTRFLASKEVNANKSFEEVIKSVPTNGTVLTMKSIRNAMRVANNEYAQKIIKMEQEGASLEELLPVISGQKSNKAIIDERYNEGQLSMGQGVGRINSVKPIAEIFQNLLVEYEEAYQHLVGLKTLT